MSNLHEALQLLQDGGVIDRLKDEAQDSKELERADLLVKLAIFEKEEARRGAMLEKVRPGLLQKIANLEAELAATRRELAALNTFTPLTGDYLRMKLRRLADPRIGQAIVQLQDLASKARGAFSTGNRKVRLLAGGYTVETTGNALTIGDILARITCTCRELDAMHEAAKPDDLVAYLAGKVDPIRVDVKALRGVK